MAAENRLALVDGALRAIRPARVLVAGEEDLAALAGRVSVGTVAHTAGYARCWRLSADGAWIACEE